MLRSGLVTGMARIVKPQEINNKPGRLEIKSVGLVLEFDSGDPAFPAAGVTTPPVGNFVWVRQIVIWPECLTSETTQRVSFNLYYGNGEPINIITILQWQRLIKVYKGYQNPNAIRLCNDGYCAGWDLRMKINLTALRFAAYGTCDNAMTYGRVHIIISYEFER